MEAIIGTKGSDQLRGVSGDNIIFGMLGDDHIVGAGVSKNVLVDGGFEGARIADGGWGTVKTVGGWKTDTSIEIWGKDFRGITATEGGKIMELDSDNRFNRVWQDVATEPGAVYEFSFDFAARSGTQIETNTIEIYWNGELAGAFDPSSSSWQKAAIKLVGSGAIDRIEFREQAGDNNSLGGLIDNVSLKALGTGADTLVGGKGNDVIEGMAGDDVLVGGSKPTSRLPTKEAMEGDNDILRAGDGHDSVYGNNGHDVIDGGNGNDALFGGRGNDVVLGGTGDDRLLGDSGNDRLADGSGDDRVYGGKGDDRVIAGSGSDHYSGGTGFDILSFEDARNGVQVDLTKHKATGMGNDSIFGVERIEGSSFDDKIKGSKHADVLVGSAGNDVLRGHRGSDVLTGGDGADTFVWRLSDLKSSYEHSEVDRITDFSLGDQLDLRELTTGMSADEIVESVLVKHEGSDAHIYVDLGFGHREFAVIEDYAGHATKDFLAEGLLLT